MARVFEIVYGSSFSSLILRDIWLGKVIYIFQRRPVFSCRLGLVCLHIERAYILFHVIA